MRDVFEGKADGAWYDYGYRTHVITDWIGSYVWALWGELESSNLLFVNTLKMAEAENGQPISAGNTDQESSVGYKDSKQLRILTNSALDEIALYDRQIRLWGVQAQEK